VPSSPVVWKYIWSFKSLPKVDHFAWLLAHNSVLTAEALRWKGWEGPSRCPLCLADEETSSHLFIFCPFAQEVLALMTSPSSISLQYEDISSLFSNWALSSPVSSHSKDFLGFSWLILPKFICWKLWLERNNRIFRGVCSSPSQVEVKIKALMGDYLCSQPVKLICSPLNSLEESWLLPLNPGNLSASGQAPKLQNWEIRKNDTDFLI